MKGMKWLLTKKIHFYSRNSASDIQNCDSFPAIFHLLQCQAMLVREIKCKSCFVCSQKEICSAALPKIFLSGESHMKWKAKFKNSQKNYSAVAVVLEQPNLVSDQSATRKLPSVDCLYIHFAPDTFVKVAGSYLHPL